MSNQQGAVLQCNGSQLPTLKSRRRASAPEEEVECFARSTVRENQAENPRGTVKVFSSKDIWLILVF